MVVHSYRQGFFRCVLTNHILIQERFNLCRLWHLELMGLLFFATLFFFDNIRAKINTLITDINTWTSD
jgi:hypothetical protein